MGSDQFSIEIHFNLLVVDPTGCAIVNYKHSLWTKYQLILVEDHLNFPMIANLIMKTSTTSGIRVVFYRKRL